MGLTAIGLMLAVVIGMSLGLLGAGGSILTVPVFVYVLGYDPKQAIAMSLLVVGATSLLGAVSHWRAGHVQLRVAVTFGVVAMSGSYLGARLSALVSGTTQLMVFGVVMLLAAGFMLRPEEALVKGPKPGERVSAPLLAILAMGAGLLTGLVGVGGGFLIVPALALGAGLPMKHAVGTSLLVIAMNAFTGFAGYLGRVEVAWSVVSVFTMVAMGGVLAGAALSRFVTGSVLRRGFALFLVAMGLFILYQNRAA
ncbi:MAG TPA: sulfite exporter TauE/SafE family protein [Gemmatimonadaceae bacterium]|nr:sulfite exporter TauE/SafE family protein [Gemmatimonadaceae bacterium]